MGINAELEVQKRDNYIKINMFSDNNAILIGKNGRTMSSMQQLLRQTIKNKLNIKSPLYKGLFCIFMGDNYGKNEC